MALLYLGFMMCLLHPIKLEIADHHRKDDRHRSRNGQTANHLNAVEPFQVKFEDDPSVCLQTILSSAISSTFQVFNIQYS